MVEADEAQRIGLIDRVVPPEEVRSASRELAGQVTQPSRAAVSLIKELVERATERSLDEQLELEAQAQERAVQSLRQSD
jgi:2-(1,2-epoxy-1,2-dihydrophenyl)acetyl-CoA isomerase